MTDEFNDITDIYQARRIMKLQQRDLKIMFMGKCIYAGLFVFTLISLGLVVIL